MHQYAVAACGQLRKHVIAGAAFGAPRLDLDELVRLQRALRLPHDRVAETGIADPDHRVQGVREPAQEFSLSFVQVHSGIFAHRVLNSGATP
jgi:hypothetical protein